VIGIYWLADGAGQIFARAVADLGGSQDAVIPAIDYEEGLPTDSQPVYDNFSSYRESDRF